MAVTKIWTIKDSLQRVLDYAANPDKTEYDALAQTLHYAENDAKTKLNESAQLVTGIHCRVDHAWEDMRAVQERFGKTDGVVALHAYQSFREGEVTPEQCHEIGVALARKVWGKRFQVLVATHMNTNNLHNHFVINSVSYVDGKKYEPKDEADTQRIVEELKKEAFAVKTVKRTDKQRSPTPPFTTSSLQQEASRKLNMTPRRTMAIAQQLYEGVDITGEGTVGLITYMRTDSLRISDEAQAQARELIQSRYGTAYCPDVPRKYKTKAGAQDAHEAIRPSDPALTPEQVKGDLTPEQYRLYRLIWSRFLASQMSNAVYDSVSVDIAAGEHTFRASASSLKVAGYTAVYEESRDDDKEEKEPALPELQPGEVVTLEGFEPGQHFTQPPARYTDATLIRTMEENGIGRPSTYAPTVSTILDREYVVKEGKALRITPLGQVVTDLMCQRFPDIVDVKFTARMEDELDDVESGKIPWKQLLRQFYGGFESNLQQVEKDMEGVYLKVPDEVTEEKCDVCGRNMVVKSGRFGRFLACPGYPECKFTKPLVVEMPGRCPKCGGRILKKTSRNGYTYYGCDKFPACDFMTWDVPVKDDCPVCGKTMFKKAGKGFNKPFCANPECPNFLPEDKRGYRRRKTDDAAASAEGGAPAAEEKPAAQPETKKSAAKKTTAAKKPAAAKKTTAAKKPAAAKKTTTKKTTTKKAEE